MDDVGARAREREGGGGGACEGSGSGARVRRHSGDAIKRASSVPRFSMERR